MQLALVPVQFPPVLTQLPAVAAQFGIVLPQFASCLARALLVACANFTAQLAPVLVAFAHVLADFTPVVADFPAVLHDFPFVGPDFSEGCGIGGMRGGDGAEREQCTDSGGKFQFQHGVDLPRFGLVDGNAKVETRMFSVRSSAFVLVLTSTRGRR
jgi:hypothetical protein